MKFVAERQGNEIFLKAGDSRGESVHQLSASECADLLSCVEAALDGSDNEHISRSGGTFKLKLQVSDRCSQVYYVNERKLVELRIQLMGV